MYSNEIAGKFPNFQGSKENIAQMLDSKNEWMMIGTIKCTIIERSNSVIELP